MKDLKGLHTIYIAGYGRSGSTLLSLLLNVKKGVITVGEIERLFWIEDEYPEYWKRLKTETLDDIEKNGLELKNTSTLIWFLFKRKQGVEQFKKLWATPLLKIARDFKASHLIDISKSTFRTFSRPMNYQRAGASVKVIHLIRNPHGVVASYKKGRNIGNSEELGKAKTGGAIRCLINWFFTNTMTSLIYPTQFDKTELYVLNYDHLMSNYDTEITKLFQFLEIEIPPAILEETIVLEEDMSFSGNRMRLNETIKIRPNPPKKQKGFMGTIVNTSNFIYKLIEPRYGNK